MRQARPPQPAPVTAAGGQRMGQAGRLRWDWQGASERIACFLKITPPGVFFLSLSPFF